MDKQLTKSIRDLQVLLIMLLSTLQSCGMTCNRVVIPERVYHGIVSLDTLAESEGAEILIKKDIDLHGAVCKIPEGMTLRFKGGKIRNGQLVGDNTKIKYQGTVFEEIGIAGTWEVLEIRSSMFADIKQPNVLKDLMALASPNCKNRIVIEPGTYTVAAMKNGDVCLRTCSNTELVINGTIQLLSNDYSNYYILQAEGNDVVVRGKGEIIGDKHTHDGKTGEWGMGINVVKGHHVRISGITVKDCWGDCIYIGARSSDVEISKCGLDHGRRQAISITSGKNIYIHNCVITNVGGTPPEYAIDIEPNEADTVSHVIIEKVKMENCVGGVMTTVFGRDARSKVFNVKIKNCQISTVGDEPLRITRCDTAVVSRCKIYASNKTTIINLFKVNYAELHNNTLNIRGDLLTGIQNGIKDAMGKGSYMPVKNNQCGIINEKRTRIVYE